MVNSPCSKQSESDDYQRLQRRFFLDYSKNMRTLFRSLLAHKALFGLLMAMTLVLVQGAQLHLHVYAHDAAGSDHGHHNYAHADIGTGDELHADKLGEIDLSPDNITQNLSFEMPSIALLALLVVFLAFRPTRAWLSWEQSVPLPARRYRLCPPLRAPPR